MRLVAVVTVDQEECLGSDFARLLRSGAHEIDKWFVVLRSTNPTAREDCERVLRGFGVISAATIVATVPCGISRARNEGLKTYFASGLVSAEDIVCFPDDDCHFSEGFGAIVRERYSSERADLVVMPYAPHANQVDRVRWPLTLDEVTPSMLMQVTSSAGIFIRATAVEKVGGFDERFGVGGPLAAAEDVDFVLRSFRYGLRIRYWGDIAVLHAYKAAVPDRQLGNFALRRRHRDLLPPLAQVRAFAKIALGTRGSRGNAALNKLPLPLLQGLDVSPRHLPLRRSVAGLQIDTSSPKELVDRASDFVVHAEGRTKSVLAAHITSLNHSASSTFKEAFNRADITMVDGISLSVISWFTPGPRLQKLATTDFAPAVFEQTAHRLGRPVRVGIIGGEKHIAVRAAEELGAMPEVDVVYSTHGYWDNFADPIKQLNSKGPEIVVLGLGMPMEAVWLQEHQLSIHAPLVITCGGWLRLLAQVEKRAPLVLQKVHAEWLWRLSTDSKRTSPRYIKGLRTVAKAIAAPWSL